MAGLKDISMRDYLPSASERYKTRGLLGVLTGPTERDKQIAEAYAQFAQGLQPTTVNAGPLQGGYVPLEQGQQQAGQADYAGLLNHLLASGPQGLEQAKQVASMLGMGNKKPIGSTGLTNTVVNFVAAGGDPTVLGLPKDSITKEMAIEMQRNNPWITQTYVDDQGNIRTRQAPRSDVARGGMPAYGAPDGSQIVGNVPSVTSTTKPYRMSVADAGRVNLLQSGIEDINAASELLFPNGMDKPVDPMVVAAAAVPGGGVGVGREVRQRLRTAIAAKLLAQTGVTARADELDTMVDSYIPQIMDIPNKGLSAKKINRLNDFMKGTINMTYLPKSYRDRVNAHIKQNKQKLKSSSDQSYEELKRKAGL